MGGYLIVFQSQMFYFYPCVLVTYVYFCNIYILTVPELSFIPTDEVVELSKSGNVSASIGESLNLTCRGYSCLADSFVFEWYLNGAELNNVSGVNIETVGEDELSHLTVNIASESLFGNYTCEVVNFGISTSLLVYELGEQYTCDFVYK